MSTDQAILVADDDQQVRELHARIFRQMGFRVVMASNGFDAIKTFRHEGGDIGLVVTDYQMGFGMNGLDVVKAIKGYSPATPVVLVTSDAPKAVKAMFNRVLTKPVDLAELRRLTQLL